MQCFTKAVCIRFMIIMRLTVRQDVSPSSTSTRIPVQGPDVLRCGSGACCGVEGGRFMPKSRDCSLDALFRRDILQCLAPVGETQQRQVVFFGKGRLQRLYLKPHSLTAHMLTLRRLATGDSLVRQLALQLLAMLRGLEQSVDIYYHTSLRFDVCLEADSMKTLCAVCRSLTISDHLLSKSTALA